MLIVHTRDEICCRTLKVVAGHQMNFQICNGEFDNLVHYGSGFKLKLMS